MIPRATLTGAPGKIAAHVRAARRTLLRVVRSETFFGAILLTIFIGGMVLASVAREHHPHRGRWQDAAIAVQQSIVELRLGQPVSDRRVDHCLHQTSENPVECIVDAFDLEAP